MALKTKNAERRVITTSSLKEKKEPEKGVNPLRPQSFGSYIGQTKVKEQVSVSVRSAIKRGKPASHMLFYGPPGLGKTTMAYIVANEEGVPIKEVAGPSIEKPGDVAAILMGLHSGQVLFIDEIHRMPPMCEEVLYSAMEDNYLNITVGAGEQQRTVHVNLPGFTLIGATTRAGMLSAPLRDRFSLKCRLEYYTFDELSQIALISAEKMELRLSQKDAEMIAGASRGTPRIVNSLVERVRDYATVKSEGKIEEDTVSEALSLAGINKNGLTETDIRILQKLQDSTRPVGLQTLADITGEDPETIECMNEPFLIQKGYIEKTPRGRMISWEGTQVLLGTGSADSTDT